MAGPSVVSEEPADSPIFLNSDLARLTTDEWIPPQRPLSEEITTKRVLPPSGEVASEFLKISGGCKREGVKQRCGQHAIEEPWLPGVIPPRPVNHISSALSAHLRWPFRKP